jgi:ribulose-5-phosphate 4-epimerase/fuculose-1-phosphate aldolase
VRSLIAALAAALLWTMPPLTALAQEATPLPAVVMSDLVMANHILVDQGVIDVRGHVSVRDPARPDVFWITRAIAPGLATAADMQAFDLDGKQVGGARGEAYTERFIHARIYKARPDVKSIVHGHTPSLINFSVSGIPLRPVMLGGVFAGDGVPIHVNGPVGEGIHDIPVGDALAKMLGDKAVVLMRGHGAVVVGVSIKSAVGRAVGLDQNAQMLINLLAMHARPDYLTPPPGAAKQAGNYDREWSWWAHKVEADH